MEDYKTKYNRICKTDFLLPKNNFLVGIGSVLNLAGSYFEYRYSKSGAEADYKALKSDWDNVGEDLRESEAKFNKDACLK